MNELIDKLIKFIESCIEAIRHLVKSARSLNDKY